MTRFREKSAPRKSKASTQGASKRSRPSRRSRAGTPELKPSAMPRKHTPQISPIDPSTSIAERVEAERERIFRAVSIVLCCWYAMVTKWNVDNHEYMIPAFKTVCDLLNDATDELEGIASACEALD